MISSIVSLYVLVFISIFCSSIARLVENSRAGEKYKNRDSIRAAEVLVKENKSRILWSPMWPIKLVIDLAHIFKNNKLS